MAKFFKAIKPLRVPVPKGADEAYIQAAAALEAALRDNFMELFKRLGRIDGDGGELSKSIDVVVNSLMPVGYVIQTTNAENPASNLGGVWSLCAKGRAAAGVDPNDEAYKTAGAQIGDRTRALTQSNLPTQDGAGAPIDITPPSELFYFWRREA